MQHKTRKQLRQESETVKSELEVIKSPEGAAKFLFERRQDEEWARDFHDAMDAQLEAYAANQAAELAATEELPSPSEEPTEPIEPLASEGTSTQPEA